MELRALQSPAISSSIPLNGVKEKSFLCGGAINLRTTNPVNIRNSCARRRLKYFDLRAQASTGTTGLSSKALEETPRKIDQKDGNIVFVAGATGRVGSRTVRELLKLGFRVRAGVRSSQRAQSLVQSVKQMKLDLGASEGNEPIEKLEIVECDLEKKDQIGQALGDASVVICCIGASEKEVFDVTGPYRIDYQASKNLIDAAAVAKVDHFILLTSLGTNKIGFPAAILNLFWGVLCWKRKAEEALVASGLPYTIVRPGGMERPTDSYKETHNITLSPEDTLFGGQVSNLQVAELMAVMAKNRSLSYCKVVEVIAETTAPLIPMEELLAKIPSQRAEELSRLEAASPETTTSETVNTSVEEKPTQEAAVAPTPLSPYTSYEDLKPPTSPTPTPSGAVKLQGSDAGKITETPNSTSSSVEIESSESSNTTIEIKEPQTEKKKTSPLSPYINYEDLKPPTSPTPSQPGRPKEAETLASAADSDESKRTAVIESTTMPSTRPLSPYTAYEDLKPPSSPTPVASGPKEVASNASAAAEIASQLTGGNDVVQSLSAGGFDNGSPVSSNSPYPIYDDLKPPSSPSPNAPVSGESQHQPPADKSGDTQHQEKPKSSPLSPYTMYEDLKPPSSPTPSPRKL